MRAGYLVLISGWGGRSPSMKTSIGISVVGNFLSNANGKRFSDYIQRSSFHMAVLEQLRLRLVVFVLKIFSV